MKTAETYRSDELNTLCSSVRCLCEEENFDECCEMIYKAMYDFPHSAVPHNLLGLVLEKTGDHLTAMKHFRAAWALDPTYRPASQNLHNYGTFYSNGVCAFDESDVEPEAPSNIKIVYDKRGVGHAVSKNRIEYDEHGIGHVIRG